MEEIKPLVEEAKQAVGNIKASTLSEIRSLRAPPDVIRDVLEGVLCLMGTQDLSWNRCQLQTDIWLFYQFRPSTRHKHFIKILVGISELLVIFNGP